MRLGTTSSPCPVNLTESFHRIEDPDCSVSAHRVEIFSATWSRHRSRGLLPDELIGGIAGVVSHSIEVDCESRVIAEHSWHEDVEGAPWPRGVAQARS